MRKRRKLCYISTVFFSMWFLRFDHKDLRLWDCIAMSTYFVHWVHYFSYSFALFTCTLLDCIQIIYRVMVTMQVWPFQNVTHRSQCSKTCLVSVQKCQLIMSQCDWMMKITLKWQVLRREFGDDSNIGCEETLGPDNRDISGISHCAWIVFSFTNEPHDIHLITIAMVTHVKSCKYTWSHAN